MPVGAENKTRNVRYAVGCAEQGHGVTLGRTMRQNLYAARGYGAMKYIMLGRAARRKRYDIRVRAPRRKIRHSTIPSGRAANKRATRVTCYDTTP